MLPPSDEKALLKFIDNIRLTLKREDAARFMVARPTLSQFQQQDLPDHVKLTSKKRTGPRQIIYKSRSSKFPPVMQARWPQDCMTENIFPSLVCVVRGAADMHIEDYVVSCKTGDFIFYPAGTASANGQHPHLEGDISGRQCSLLWIYPGRINDDGIECYTCHSSAKGHSSDNHIWCHAQIFVELLQSIEKETTKQSNNDIIFHLLSTLFALLQRDIATDSVIFSPFRLLPDAVESEQENIHAPIKRACAYIKNNLKENLTIAVVAKHVFLSPSAFSRLFKQEMGQTFHQYCTAIRMEYAAALLRHTSITIQSVSAQIGITDNQFRLLARKYWGCLPSEFRLKNIK